MTTMDKSKKLQGDKNYKLLRSASHELAVIYKRSRNTGRLNQLISVMSTKYPNLLELTEAISIHGKKCSQFKRRYLVNLLHKDLGRLYSTDFTYERQFMDLEIPVMLRKQAELEGVLL